MALTVDGIGILTYVGEGIETELTVRGGDKIFVEGVDYRATQ
ncbi:MAG: hypothetical protein Q4E13_05700 [Clostridia bacterium]|nr:hypothetical protein [Clostridia bacterium]